MDASKLEKLNHLLKSIKRNSVSPKEIEDFLKMVLETVKSSKDELRGISDENVQKISDYVALLEENSEKALSAVDAKSNALTGQIDAKIALLKGLIAKVKTIKPKDGVNPDPSEIVPLVLAQIKLPEVQEVILDDREKIVEKINSGEKKDTKIELKQIEGTDKLEKGIVDRAVSILDQRTKFLINKNVKHDGTLSGSGTDADPLSVVSSGGGTWGSITGTLSDQTDLQTALDAKVDENVAITGATKTKITYDAKGLVTAGTDATTADIADSTNKRYVTDADLVDIGNLSGTNTGDQTSIVGITGTKAQFDTAVTDGNFLYVGDITQYTDEMAQDATGAMVDSTLVYVDATPLLTRAALTGDITAPQGSNATTLATVNANVGIFGSATQVGTFTVNAKGLTTAASNVTVTPAVGSITGLGTGVATALGVNVGSAGAFVVNGGALGTPSSGTVTNLTGTAGINITGTAPAGTLTGTTLNATVVTSSLTSVGTITTGVWTGTDIAVADGGTGRSTSTTAYGLIAAGTTATGAHQTLAAGATTEILVGGGTAALPVWTTATGTGAPVRATSPALVTPALGTPTALVLTNATDLPTAGLLDDAVTYAKMQNVSATSRILGRSTAGAGDVEELTAGTGVITFLGTPSSANLAAALTDETGTGVAVFGTSPTFTTSIKGASTPTIGSTTLSEKFGHTYLGDGKDLFPDNDIYGLWNRKINYGFTPDEHWGQNADELSWTGYATYTGFVTPGSITTSLSTYKTAHSAAGKSFRYRAAATGGQIYLRTRCGITFQCSAGVMVDDGVDDGDSEGATNFYRVYATQSTLGGPVTIVEQYRTGGGAVTTNVGPTMPYGEFFGIGLRCVAGTLWSSWSANPFTFGESQEAVQFTGGTAPMSWTPARVGLYGVYSAVDFGRKAMFDWYDEATT